MLSSFLLGQANLLFLVTVLKTVLHKTVREAVLKAIRDSVFEKGTLRRFENDS